MERHAESRSRSASKSRHYVPSGIPAPRGHGTSSVRALIVAISSCCAVLLVLIAIGLWPWRSRDHAPSEPGRPRGSASVGMPETPLSAWDDEARSSRRVVESLPVDVIQCEAPPESVQVTVQGYDGKRVSVPVRVLLSMRPEDGRPGPSWRTVEEGVGLFEVPALGLEVSALAKSYTFGPEVGSQVCGPSHSGQIVPMVLRMGTDHPVLDLRLTGPGAMPLCDERLTLILADKGRRPRADAWTDGSGRLLVGLRDSKSRGDRHLLLRSKRGWSAVVDLKEAYRPGINDPIPVRMRGETLAAGRVLDLDGKPIPLVSIQTRVPTSGGWRYAYELRTRTDTDGSFVVRGSLPAKRLEVTAYRPGFLRTERKCRKGQRHVELTLTYSSKLDGTLLVDPFIDPTKLRLSLVTPGGPPEAVGSTYPDPSGTFRFSGVSPGTYDFEVGPSRKAVYSVPYVIVGESETYPDPRLNPLDLRGRIEKRDLD